MLQVLAANRRISTTRLDEKILQLLDKVAYRRILPGKEMEKVHRLRYDAYVRARMISEDAECLDGKGFSDEHDEDPNCYNVGIFQDGTLLGCMRLHVAGLGHRAMPSSHHIADLLDPWLDAGQVLVDSSRLAHVESRGGAMRLLPYVSMRLCAMACVHFDADYSVQVVQVKHAGFYEHLICSELLDTRNIAFTGNPFPVSVLRSHIPSMRKFCYSDRAHLLSTPQERAGLFGPASGQGFVTPSARRVIHEGEESGY